MVSLLRKPSVIPHLPVLRHFTKHDIRAVSENRQQAMVTSLQKNRQPEVRLTVPLTVQRQAVTVHGEHVTAYVS